MALLYKLDTKKSLKNKKDFSKLKILVNKDLIKVNNLIKRRLSDDIPLIELVSKHVFNAGGKRIRPMLCLASAKLCDYSDKNIIELAACVEFEDQKTC